LYRLRRRQRSLHLRLFVVRGYFHRRCVPRRIDHLAAGRSAQGAPEPACMSSRGYHGASPVMRLLGRLEKPFSKWFDGENSPLHHLGALTIYFLWIILVSGIYLFVFYDTSVTGAWPSLEKITHGQWYAGGVMRSLHRYASDAAVITMVLHMSREFLRGRYRGVRWYSWFTG